MQLGFYFNQTRCTGCGACQVACKDWNDIPAGPEKWMRMVYQERGAGSGIFVSYLAVPCYHCIAPVCMPACPADAISKNPENGIVTVDSEACWGNETCDEKCLKACPYDAPQFGPEPGAKMKKCDFCMSRWNEGKLPICVEACPTRAFDAGDLNDLKTRYGEITEAEGFTFNKRVKPSVVFAPKKK